MAKNRPDSLLEPDYTRFNGNSTALEVLEGLDLSDKTILITGTTSGLGYETARSLAIHGAYVVMANRSIAKSEEVRDEIYKETKYRRISFIEMDLSSSESVKAGARHFLSKNRRLDVLILNAGCIKAQPSTTINNFNTVLQVNYLSHFYLTHLLRSKLSECAPSRVVVVTSIAHRHTWIRSSTPLETKLDKLFFLPNPSHLPYLQYATTKLGGILFAFKLHRVMKNQNVSIFAVHPGSFIPTRITRNYSFYDKMHRWLFKYFSKSVQQGAASMVYCAVFPKIEKRSGCYFEECSDDQKGLQVSLTRDERLQDEFWNRSMAVIKEFEKSSES